MYCQCDKPKEKINGASGISFKVCARSIGGCGKEIKEGHKVEKIDLTKGLSEGNKCHTLDAHLKHREIIRVILGDKFANFLIDHAVLNQYCEEFKKKYNIDKKNYKDFKNTLILALNSSFKEKFLTKAFPWNMSNRGFRFWKRLNDEWEKKCLN